VHCSAPMQDVGTCDMIEATYHGNSSVPCMLAIGSFFREQHVRTMRAF
jgi:hypothetical protein